MPQKAAQDIYAHFGNALEDIKKGMPVHEQPIQFHTELYIGMQKGLMVNICKGKILKIYKYNHNHGSCIIVLYEIL